MMKLWVALALNLVVVFLIGSIIPCNANDESASITRLITLNEYNKKGVDIHVDSSQVVVNGVLRDGTLKRPYVLLSEAKNHIIHSHASMRPRNVFIHSGRYGPLHIDHPALSGIAWRGVDGEKFPLISGGVVVPSDRFHRSEKLPEGVLVASLDGLNVTDLGDMISGNAVSDCQHDKVGLSYGGKQMTLARWPNVKRDENNTWQWAHATVDPHSTPTNRFTMNTTKDPDAKRILSWRLEKNPYVHGYFSWDWADAYASVTHISKHGELLQLQYSDAPNCKPWARWMGVNLLCELDQPGEYYLDAQEKLLYFYPPSPLYSNRVTLMYQKGSVVNISANVNNVRLSKLEIANGRHIGIAAVGVHGITIDNVIVHAHGTHGIDLTNATDSVISNSEIFDIGCTGILATSGIASTLEPGSLNIEGNRVHHNAQWKRTYHPGIYWGGVNNTYRENHVYFSPHNCFLGGGNFEDGVNNLFEGNTLSDCTFETTDSGAFYTCGQMGQAFVNRGNILHGNTFIRIRNTAGLGVQVASNQAIYLDDQMSAWIITNNTFIDCQVASFIGGGRHNTVMGNRFIRCGTIQYMNDQGVTWDSKTVNCTDISPPGSTTCSTGAAEWMLTEAPAAEEWAALWPQMKNISSDPHLGYPDGTVIKGNTYCNCTEFFSSNVPESDIEKWGVTVTDNQEDYLCYK